MHLASSHQESLLLLEFSPYTHPVSLPGWVLLTLSSSFNPSFLWEFFPDHFPNYKSSKIFPAAPHASHWKSSLSRACDHCLFSQVECKLHRSRDWVCPSTASSIYGIRGVSEVCAEWMPIKISQMRSAYIHHTILSKQTEECLWIIVGKLTISNFMCQRRKYLEQISISSLITALKQGFQCALLAVRRSSFYKFSSEKQKKMVHSEPRTEKLICQGR